MTLIYFLREKGKQRLAFNNKVSMSEHFKLKCTLQTSIAFAIANHIIDTGCNSLLSTFVLIPNPRKQFSQMFKSYRCVMCHSSIIYRMCI